MKKLFFFILFAIFYTGVKVPEAKAFDPVTLAILAPYAMPYAEAAGKQALKGMVNAAPAMMDVLTNMLSIFLLPLGVIEVTVGAPFGFFGDGCYNIADGVMAPFKMVYSMLTVPVKLTGLF